MAGVYIKGMEMPKSCFYCPFREKVNPDDYVCMAMNKEFEETFALIAGTRHKDCPLISVPSHGDLIDRGALSRSLDELCERICQYSKAQRKVMCSSCPLGDAFIVVEDDAPAIIEEDPKERSEDK